MIAKNILTVLSFAICLFALSACSLLPTQSDTSESTDQPLPAASDQTDLPTSSDQNPDIMAAINTRHGQIVIKLYKDIAPNTVKNFLAKIDSGFYNGLIFHRFEPGFVIQGGDPKGDGTGGGTIKSEINDRLFTRGSVGLARGAIKEQSNDSQFFICLSDQGCQHLTNEYVNFGEVVYGMDMVDQIGVGDKIESAVTKTK